MSAQIPIRPIEDLKFGKTLLASELECMLQYMVYSYGAGHADYIGGTHPLQVMIDDVKRVFAGISNLTFPATAGASTAQVAFRNLARLARLDLKGDALVYQLRNLHTAMMLLPSGEHCTGSDAAVLPYMVIAKFVTGKHMTNLIGTWDNQKYVDQDEVLGGMWLVLLWVLQFWNMHLASELNLLHSIGEYTKDAAAARGSFRPLIPSDPKTWGAILVAQENSTTTDLFSKSTAQLDDPALRAITVAKYTGFEKLMNEVMTPSQWTWRFGRWVRIIPVYTIYNPQVEATNLGNQIGDFSSTTNFLLFGNDAGGNLWRDFNNQINEIVTDIKTFYFRNSAYATLKAKVNLIPFGELPTPASSGNGGILLHQFYNREDGGVGQDKVYNKIYVDTHKNGHRTLMCRRKFNDDKRFVMYGDITVDAYRLMVGLAADQIDDQAHVPEEGVAMTGGAAISPFEPIACFGVGIGKTEDEQYKLGRVIYDSTASALGDPDYSYADDGIETPVAPIAWQDYTNSDDLTFPVSLARSKELFKYGRSADPYKKLKHQLVDINELDIDLVTQTVVNYIWPAGAGSIEASPIAVSAAAESPTAQLEIPNLGGEQTKISDDVNTPNERKVDDSIPVSATVDSIKKTIKVAEKDLKVAEKKEADKK